MRREAQGKFPRKGRFQARRRSSRSNGKRRKQGGGQSLGVKSMGPANRSYGLSKPLPFDRFASKLSPMVLNTRRTAGYGIRGTCHHLKALTQLPVCAKRQRLVEHQNLVIRMSMRRSTRRMNAHSKKYDQYFCMLALYSMHYNFCRKHQTRGKHHQWRQIWESSTLWRGLWGSLMPLCQSQSCRRITKSVDRQRE